MRKGTKRGGLAFRRRSDHVHVLHGSSTDVMCREHSRLNTVLSRWHAGELNLVQSLVVGSLERQHAGAKQSIAVHLDAERTVGGVRLHGHRDSHRRGRSPASPSNAHCDDVGRSIRMDSGGHEGGGNEVQSKRSDVSRPYLLLLLDERNALGQLVADKRPNLVLDLDVACRLRRG